MSSHLSTFYGGLHPRYIWKDGKIGSQSMFVGHHEDTECWMALFLDLLFVAFFSKLSHLLLECEITSDLLVYCFCYNLFFYLGRFSIDEYSIRFYQDDIFHRLLYFLYTIGVLVMVMNIDQEKTAIHSGDDHAYYYHQLSTSNLSNSESTEENTFHCKLNNFFYTGVTYGYCITKLSIVGLYCGLIWLDKSNKILEQFGFRCLTLILSSLLFLFGDFIITDVAMKIYLLIGVAVVELSNYFGISLFFYLKANNYVTTKWMTFHYPIGYLEAQEKTGVFILIVIGEAIITLVTPTWEKGIASDVYLINLFGLLLVFAFAMLYFDKTQRRSGEPHAMRRNMFSGLLFMLCHPLVGFSLLLTTQGIIDVANSVRGGYSTTTGKQLLSYGCALTTGLLFLMRTAHQGFANRWKTWGKLAHLGMYVILFLAHLSVLTSQAAAKDNIVIHACIALFTVMFEVSISYYRNWKFEQQKEIQGNTDESGGGSSNSQHHVIVTSVTATAAESLSKFSFTNPLQEKLLSSPISDRHNDEENKDNEKISSKI
jgi:low temperature requirement protein LtrA